MISFVHIYFITKNERLYKLCFCCIILLISRASAHAQNYYSVGVGANANLIRNDLAVLSFRAASEYGFNKTFGLRFDFTTGPFAEGDSKSGKATLYTVKVNGWGFDLSPRFYLQSKKRNGPYGFYIGPTFIYRRVSETFDGYPSSSKSSKTYLSETGNAFGAGVTLGWKIAKRYFFVEPGLCISYASAKYPSSEAHKMISIYYQTTELFNINAYVCIGLVYSKAIRENK